MITNEYLQYFMYAILLYLAYRIVANGIDLKRLKKIKTDLINS